MRIGLSLLFVFTPTSTRAEDLPIPLDAKTVKAKLKGEWREFDVRIPRAKQLRESFGMQWTMYKPADKTSPANQAWTTDHDNESTQTGGVLLLDTDKNPMWLDFRFQDGNGEYVQVGILRFDNDKPRWVLNKEWIRVATYEKAKGKVSERPTKFEDDNKRPIGLWLEPFTFDKE